MRKNSSIERTTQQKVSAPILRFLRPCLKKGNQMKISLESYHFLIDTFSILHFSQYRVNNSIMLHSILKKPWTYKDYITRQIFYVLLIYKYKIRRHIKDYFTLECNVSSFIQLTHPVVIKNSIHGKWKENMYYNAGILQIFHRALHFIKSVTCSTGWRNNMFNLCTSVSSDIQVLLENTYVKTL